MAKITAKLLAKNRGVALADLLADLRKNISGLTKDEKFILTELLNEKRGSMRQTLSSKKTLSIKPSNNKSSGVNVQIKRKKAVDDSTQSSVISKQDQQTLQSHHQSIEKSREQAEQFQHQDAKRQDLMRQQLEAQKTQETEATQKTQETEATQKPTKDTTKPNSELKKPIGSPRRRIVIVDKSNAIKTTKKYTNTYQPSLSRKLKKKDKTRLSQQLREEQTTQHQFVKPVDKVIYEVKIPEVIAVSALAEQMKVKAAEVLKQMMVMGVQATINDNIDQDTAMLVVEEMGHSAQAHEPTSVEDIALLELIDIDDKDKLPRPPVVAMMGHVDHGKTSLLDYIRKASVAKGEAGGITQHIGAYQVHTKYGDITFLDTPGHSAFTQMRSRGASATDIVILVVAADDGVMPETIDSIKHTKAAKTTMIVAINKMDKEGANSEKVKKMLSTHEVIDESWGGDTIMVEVSAHSGQGIDNLLETIILQTEVLELSAVTKARAKGVVLESRMEKGRGKVSTLLVQEGTLQKGDIVVAGQEYGKVKQLLNDTGQVLKSATPSVPVEILGLSGVPKAGDNFMVLNNERKAKEVVDYRRHKNKEGRLQKQQAVKIEDFMTQMQEANKQKINILLKTDVQGSSQAIASALEDLSNDELNINIVATGVGGINDTDMALASASGAVVLGFGVRADAIAKKTADKDGVDVRYYSIIYNLIDDVKAMMLGLIAPKLSEEIIGLAEVKEVFKSKALGDIAGCIVIEGKVKHNRPIRVLRDNVVIYEGELESLRRFKDEVVEVVSGTECGIGVKDYNDIIVGDQIEVFERIETPTKL